MVYASEQSERSRAELTWAVLEVVTQVALELRRSADGSAPAPTVRASFPDENPSAPVPVESLQSELDGLRAAMSTRAVIEQAKGMLMLRHRCDAERAFAILIKSSQVLQLKLRDVAQHVVEWGSNRGDDEPAVP